ncbi:hypothetical protein KBD81_05150 [Candidatus Woesebacteria bacterium]|nr:hypothetical protein [Candidatus Woesebacteria bacterium]
MIEKAIGYSLLTIGILLMIFAVIQIIFVFTGKSEPAQVFSYKEPEKVQVIDTPIDQEALLRQLKSGGLSGLMGSGVAGDLSGFGIDPEMINKTINLTIYYFIMQFLMGFGFKLSTLGVQMLRPLTVVVKRNEVADMIDPVSPPTK